MMRWDFTDVMDTEDYASLPQGWYTVRVDEVRSGRTRDGDERWGMRLVVADGPFAGRTAAWDGLVWSERGSPRAKRLLEALGIDAKGVVELETQDLLGRDLDVELVTEEWENPSTGRRQRRNRVPYEGFAARGSANTRIGSEGSEEPAPLREGACPQEAWPP